MSKDTPQITEYKKAICQIIKYEFGMYARRVEVRKCYMEILDLGHLWRDYLSFIMWDDEMMEKI